MKVSQRTVYFSLALFLFGCSPQKETSSIRLDASSSAELKHTNIQQIHHTSNSTNGVIEIENTLHSSDLKFSKVKGNGFGYGYMAQYFFEQFPNLKDALKKAPEAINEPFSDKDVEWITSELKSIDNFVPAPQGGILIDHDKFLIAIVGGFVDDKYFNVYFMRIPGYGWTYLEKREVPAPLGTFRP